MKDIDVLDNEPLTRGTVLWPKLKAFIISICIIIVFIITIIYGFIGYNISRKSKDITERDCADIVEKLKETNTITKIYDKDYPSFIVSLKLLMNEYDWKIKKIAEENTKDEMISNFAHDIKTPLTSVIGYLQLLESDDDMSEKSRKKYNKIALDKSLHLEKLLDELFYISKYDFEHTKKSKEKINLTLFLNQLRDEFYPQLIEKEMRLIIQVNENFTISTNAEELAKAIGNILKNAINYSYSKSEITLKVASIDNDLSIQIENEADTLNDGEIALIFTRFYRGDYSRSSAKGGSGLGLAIAKTIIENMGGNIAASSENNKFKMIINIPKLIV